MSFTKQVPSEFFMKTLLGQYVLNTLKPYLSTENSTSREDY